MDGGNLTRLQKICKYARYLVLVLLALEVLAAIGSVAILGMLIADPGLAYPEQGMSHGYLMSMAVSNVGGMVFLIAAIYYLYRLTDSMSREESPFVERNVRYLKLIAVMLAVCWIIVLALRVVFSMDGSTPVSTDVTLLLMAGIIYVISLVFEYGVALQNESDSFV